MDSGIFVTGCYILDDIPAMFRETCFLPSIELSNLYICTLDPQLLFQPSFTFAFSQLLPAS